MILDKLKEKFFSESMKRFWRNQELANHFVHFLFGFWASYFLWYTGFNYLSLLGFIIPFSFELARQTLLEDPEYKTIYFLDKFRDMCFYAIGSLFTLVIRKFPI